MRYTISDAQNRVKKKGSRKSIEKNNERARQIKIGNLQEFKKTEKLAIYLTHAYNSVLNEETVPELGRY